MRGSHAYRGRLLAASLLALALAPPVGAWPKVPLPDGASGQAVSKNMLYNGVPMRASQVSFPMSVDDAIEFYRRQWGSEVVVDRLDGKTIVGHLEGKHYVTVELTGMGSRSQGTVGVMELPDKPVEAELGKGFDKPANTEVVSDIRYLDTSNDARTLVMKNRLSPYVNMRYYVQRLQMRGWKLERDPEQCLASSNECVVNLAGSGDARLSLALTRDQPPETVIVVNIE
ncbi:hypothetical protein [Marilutibacter maris]|uniref:Uncharacterized protein n=1 Tax=Marilutibacter maris TaxID=1605891 RepID=A0A2U9T5Q9_9GAMM|nr:hypothetical protein [Lysobacter maris]AWV05818.1 hypothetical protein C9I47_0092 [Lysobacter maris]KAB8162454.1 hypothetical protein FKV24_018345 [Lysobacter maris]